MPTSGIYKAISKQTGKVYVGGSRSIFRRIRRHKTDLRHNNHCNKYLQRHVNKYGLDDLVFSLTGETVEGIDIYKFSIENALCYNSMLRVIRGERKRHKIWEHV